MPTYKLSDPSTGLLWLGNFMSRNRDPNCLYSDRFPFFDEFGSAFDQHQRVHLTYKDYLVYTLLHPKLSRNLVLKTYGKNMSYDDIVLPAVDHYPELMLLNGILTKVKKEFVIHHFNDLSSKKKESVVYNFSFICLLETSMKISTYVPEGREVRNLPANCAVFNRVVYVKDDITLMALKLHGLQSSYIFDIQQMIEIGRDAYHAS